MNKRLNILAITTSLALAISGNAFAGPKHGKNAYQDYADVISAKPIYRTVEVITPQRECRVHRVKRKQHGTGHRHHAHGDSYTAPLAGALVGGLVGNQFGGGNGKTALTVGGALLGASIGNDYANSTRPVHHPRHGHTVRKVRRCETVRVRETREELVGYRVKYRYNGEIHKTRMDHHPGDRIRVKVNVRPVG